MKRPPEEEARRWLEQASADMVWADRLAEQGGFHLACFLAQQIAEKALKAYLYSRGEEVVLGHSVERLAAECEEFDREFAPRRPEWAILDAYYVSTRYPNTLPDSIPARVFDRTTAERAVALARDVIAFVQGRLTT